MATLNDGSIEYFNVTDFGLLDDEEEFNKLCDDLNFNPLTGKMNQGVSDGGDDYACGSDGESVVSASSSSYTYVSHQNNQSEYTSSSSGIPPVNYGNSGYYQDRQPLYGQIYHQVTPEHYPQTPIGLENDNDANEYHYPPTLATTSALPPAVSNPNYGDYYEHHSSSYPTTPTYASHNAALPPPVVTTQMYNINGIPQVPPPQPQPHMYQQQPYPQSYSQQYVPQPHYQHQTPPQPEYQQQQPSRSYYDQDDENERSARGKKSRRPIGQSTPYSTVHCIPMMANDYRHDPAAATATVGPTPDVPEPAPTTQNAHASHYLPADDVRRSYATIFIDAINQVDDAIPLDTVLDDYCSKGICSVYKFMGKKSPHNSNYIEVHGRDAVGKYWHGIFAAYPDYHYELLGTKIKVLLNGFSCITSQFSFTATKVLNMVSDVSNTVIVTDPSKKDDINGGMSMLSFKVDGENRQVVEDEAPTANVLLTGVCKPVKVNLLGTITYYCNPDKLVYKIEVLYAHRNAEDDM